MEDGNDLGIYITVQVYANSSRRSAGKEKSWMKDWMNMENETFV